MIWSESETFYQVCDVEFVDSLLSELHNEVEPLGVTLRIYVILKNQIILELFFLRL